MVTRWRHQEEDISWLWSELAPPIGQKKFKVLRIFCLIVGSFCSNQSSVTRLSDFWKFLVIIFLTQLSQIFGDYLGYFDNIPFAAVVTFWGNFWKIGLLFIQTSVHTGSIPLFVSLCPRLLGSLATLNVFSL